MPRIPPRPALSLLHRAAHRPGHGSTLVLRRSPLGGLGVEVLLPLRPRAG